MYVETRSKIHIAFKRPSVQGITASYLSDLFLRLKLILMFIFVSIMFYFS